MSSKAEEQAERRRVLREDQSTRVARPEQSSDQQSSSNNDGEAPGGRWAGQGKPKIVQGGPDDYPRLPSSSPWAQPDPVPDEPPLGIDVNSLEPRG